MVDNMIVDDVDPFEVDEDDIMLLDRFENVNNPHTVDQILANVIGTSTSSSLTRRRNDSNAFGGSEGSSASSSTLNN
jgi:hypothetical protein